MIDGGSDEERMPSLASALRVLQRRLRREGISTAEEFVQLQVDAPGFIADLFSSDEFQAEAEAETAAMVARSAELATADAEMMGAETARACAADEAQQAKAEAEAVRAEMEMERARAQAEAAATVKAMAACISELEVSPADAVDSSSVGTQCGTRAAKVRGRAAFGGRCAFCTVARCSLGSLLSSLFALVDFDIDN